MCLSVFCDSIGVVVWRRGSSSCRTNNRGETLDGVWSGENGRVELIMYSEKCGVLFLVVVLVIDFGDSNRVMMK